MKNLLVTILVAIVVVSLVLIGCESPKPSTTQVPSQTSVALPVWPKQIRFLSSSPGGAIFPAAAYWCSVLSSELKLPVGAFPGNQTQNLPLVSNGEGEISYADSSVIYDAWQGNAPFKEKFRNLAFFFAQGTGATYCLVKNDSPIRTVNDLLGKKICIGFKGSGSEAMTLLQLEALGITKQKMEAAGGLFINLSLADGAAALGDGSIDANWLQTPPQKIQPAHASIEERFKLRIVPVPKETIDKITKERPYLIPEVVPGGIYKGSPQPVPAIGNVTLNAVRGDLPEDLVYQMLKILYKQDVIEYTRKNFTQWVFGEIEDGIKGYNVISMHPGAIKFFKEKGANIK